MKLSDRGITYERNPDKAQNPPFQLSQGGVCSHQVFATQPDLLSRNCRDIFWGSAMKVRTVSVEWEKQR